MKRHKIKFACIFDKISIPVTLKIKPGDQVSVINNDLLTSRLGLLDFLTPIRYLTI